MKRKKANVRCGKGWLRISALRGREKNIRLDFIKQVEFEKNEILIQIDGEEWTTIRRYNHQTIERYVEGKNKGYRDLFNEKGEDKYITEATNLQREWIEALGQNIPLPKGKKIYIWIEPGTDAYYLKDEDFNKLSDRLNCLIDDYAIEEEVEEVKIVLSKDDVMELICEKYDIEATYIAGQLIPKEGSVCWEGNEEK